MSWLCLSTWIKSLKIVFNYILYNLECRLMVMSTPEVIIFFNKGVGKQKTYSRNLLFDVMHSHLIIRSWFIFLFAITFLQYAWNDPHALLLEWKYFVTMGERQWDNWIEKMHRCCKLTCISVKTCLEFIILYYLILISFEILNALEWIKFLFLCHKLSFFINSLILFVAVIILNDKSSEKPVLILEMWPRTCIKSSLQQNELRSNNNKCQINPVVLVSNGVQN